MPAIKGQTLGYMTWASLGLVIVLGGATLLTHDPALRAGKTRDRAFRDRRHHAQARLDAALYAADRDRDHSGICHGRGLRLGGADVRARRRHHRGRRDRRLKLWAFYVSVVLIGAKVVAFGVQYAAFRVLVTNRIRAARA